MKRSEIRKQQREAVRLEKSEIAKNELLQQICTPLSEDQVVVDGGCSNWPYIGPRPAPYSLKISEEHYSKRRFGNATYIALDGGNSSYMLGVNLGLMNSWNNLELRNKAEEKVSVAREKGINAHYIDADLENMPFEDDSLDELFVADVLITPGITHSAMAQILAETNRVLKIGGLLVIKESGLNHSRLEFDTDSRMYVSNIKRSIDKGKNPSWSNLSLPQALLTMLEMHNFSLETFKGDEDSEALHELNSLYCTSGFVGSRLGAYIIAKKTESSLPAEETPGWLARLVGKRALV